MDIKYHITSFKNILYKKRDYFSIIIINLLQKIISLLIFSYLAKNINIEIFGIIRFNMVASSLLFLPLIGIPSAMLTFISNSKNNIEKENYFNNSFYLFFILLTVEIFILIIFKVNIYLLFFLLQTAFEAFYSSYISSLGSVVKLNLYRTIIVLLQFISIKIFLNFYPDPNLFLLTILLTIPSLISILLLEFYKRQVIVKRNFSKKIQLEIINFSFVAMIGSMSFTLINSLNTIFLKKYHNTNLVSYYSSAEMLCSIYVIIPLALTTYFTNKLAQIENIRLKFKTLLNMILFYVLISIIIFTVFYFKSKNIIILIFGNKMLQSNDIILYMSVSSIIIGLTLFMSQFYFSILKPKIPALILTSSSIIMFFLSFFLVKKFDLFGASLTLLATTLFSLMFYCISFFILIKRSKIYAVSL